MNSISRTRSPLDLTLNGQSKCPFLTLWCGTCSVQISLAGKVWLSRKRWRRFNLLTFCTICVSLFKHTRAAAVFYYITSTLNFLMKWKKRLWLIRTERSGRRSWRKRNLIVWNAFGRLKVSIIISSWAIFISNAKYKNSLVFCPRRLFWRLATIDHQSFSEWKKCISRRT